MNIQELLAITIKNKASDLHLLVDVPPTLRIDGSLVYISNWQALTKQDLETMIFSIINQDQKTVLLSNKELDFSFTFDDGSNKVLGRFRVNVYYQRGVISAAFRFLEANIKTLEDLHLPKILHDFANLKQGLVLVKGWPGKGKINDSGCHDK